MSNRPRRGEQVVVEASLVQGRVQLHYMVSLQRAMNSAHKLGRTVLTIQDRMSLNGKTISRLILGRGWGAEMLSVSLSYMGRL